MTHAGPRVPRSLYASLLVSVLVIAISQWRIDSGAVWHYPALDELVVTENYTQDLAAIALGSHRLAADLAYIQFLQYYGFRQSEPNDHHDDGRKVHTIEEMKREFEGGTYPLLKEKATRYMRLDPYFNGAILEAAGALAFNQERIDEALDYLSEAIQRDPAYYRYHLYASAILYRHQRNDQKLMGLLTQAVNFPDCPTIFQGILGNLLKKYGYYEKAANVYFHMILTAPAENDRHDAQQRLELLLREHPEVAGRLGRPPAR